MRPRDALERIAGQLDVIAAITDLDEVRRRLAVIREKTELGLAFGDHSRASCPAEAT